MPTKLGKGGAGQQNYIPAGHGDASGEYGDDATGSNKHFQTFKKPREYFKQYWKRVGPTSLSGISIKEYRKLKELGEDVEVSEITDYWKRQNIQNYLNDHPNLEDEVKNVLNNITDKNISLSDFKKKIADDLNFKRRYSDSVASVMFNAFHDEFEEKWNELHKEMIDKIENVTPEDFKKGVIASDKIGKDYVISQFELGDKEGQELLALAVVQNEVKFYGYNEIKDLDGEFIDYTCYYAGSIILDEKNDNTFHYEKGQPLYHEMFHRLDTLYSDYGELSTTLDINGKTLYDVLKKETRYTNGEKLRKKIEHDFIQWQKDFKRSKLSEEELKVYDEYSKIDEEAKKLTPGYGKEYFKYMDEHVTEEQLQACFKYDAINITHDKYVKWGDVSDIYSGSVDGQYDLMDFAHSKTYFKDKNTKANEFFAEYCSAKYTNEESYKTMKKYFPQSCEHAEKIIQYIKKNKGKWYEYR